MSKPNAIRIFDCGHVRHYRHVGALAPLGTGPCPYDGERQIVAAVVMPPDKARVGLLEEALHDALVTLSMFSDGPTGTDAEREQDVRVRD